jgi:hypothetical protein
MIDKNSMVPSSRVLIEDHYELKEVQSMRKRIKKIRRGPRRGVALRRD